MVVAEKCFALIIKTTMAGPATILGTDRLRQAQNSLTSLSMMLPVGLLFFSDALFKLRKLISVLCVVRAFSSCNHEWMLDIVGSFFCVN